MRLKFKLRLTALLAKAIQCLDKIQKVCTLVFLPEKVCVVVSSDVKAWATFAVRTLCETYRVESLNNNKIGLTVDVPNLMRALRSAQTSPDVEVKLAKKGEMPFLSFVLLNPGPQAVTVTQDVPVTVLSASQLAEVTEPQLPVPEVRIFLPQMRPLATVVERMARISDRVQLAASMSGELTVKADSDVVSVATFYSHLPTPVSDAPPAGAGGAAAAAAAPGGGRVVQSAEAWVDAKQLSRVLASHAVSPEAVVCCLLERTVVVDVRHPEEMFITYYIPTVTPVGSIG